MDSDHISRELRNDDFDQFDYIFGMDEYIVASLKKRKERFNRDAKAIVELLGNYHPTNVGRIIQDPYFNDSDDLCGYEDCYEVCTKSINAFLDQTRIRNKW